MNKKEKIMLMILITTGLITLFFVIGWIFSTYTGPVTINWLMLPGIGLRTIYIYSKDLLGNMAIVPTKILVIKE
jgi:hypothetical protein